MTILFSQGCLQVESLKANHYEVMVLHGVICICISHCVEFIGIKVHRNQGVLGMSSRFVFEILTRMGPQVPISLSLHSLGYLHLLPCSHTSTRNDSCRLLHNIHQIDTLLLNEKMLLIKSATSAASVL